MTMTSRERITAILLNHDMIYATEAARLAATIRKNFGELGI